MIITTSPQDCLDISVRGIIAQGGPARSPHGVSMYRMEDGKKCAAGQLIPDEVYYPEMEGKTIAGLRIFQYQEVVASLQYAHDHTHDREDFFEKWKAKLVSLTKSYNLDPKVLEEIPT